LFTKDGESHMQLPPSTSSADPSLAALLFPGAPASSPLGGPLATAPLGAEPASLGFEQLFAELQPATPPVAANGATATASTGPVLPAQADRTALVTFPGSFRPSPVVTGPANASGLAPRGSAPTGSTIPTASTIPMAQTAQTALAAPGAKVRQDVSVTRMQRLQAEPANKLGPLDDSAAQAAVLATAIVLPADPLPAAVLPASPKESSLSADGSDDSSALADSPVVAALTPQVGLSDPVELSRFDSVMAAFRRTPYGFGIATEQPPSSLPMMAPKAVPFSEAHNGQTHSSPVMPAPDSTRSPRPLGASPAFGIRDVSAALPVPAMLDGRAVRELAPGRAFDEASETGLNGLATPQSMLAPKAREIGRGQVPGDFGRPHQAKFADAGIVAPGEISRSEKPEDKTFLSTQGKEVADVDASFGTAVANPQSAMVSFSNGTQPYTTSDQSGGVVSAMSAARESTEQTALPSEAVSSAQEAVDTVLDATDRMQSRDQRSVNLDFTVGDAKLAVRVELQGGEVRTTFRTESPELRVALAHEWEAVAGGNEERAFRLAPPTITGTDTPARQDSFGDASSRQQERQQERESREALNVRDPAADGRARAGTTATATPAPRAPQFPSGTAQHLHHFA